MKKTLPFFISLFAMLMACSSIEITDESNADGILFVGSDLSAGFANGGLSRAGQLNSYPRWLTDQITGVQFSQPLFSEKNAKGTGTFAWIDNETAIRSQFAPNEKLEKFSGKLTNYSFPLTRMIDVPKPSLGNSTKNSLSNPFYERILNSTNADASLLSEISQQNFKTVIVEMGQNDVLSYLNTNGMSSIENFGQAATQLFNSLAMKASQGLVITIPSPQSLPKFIAFETIKNNEKLVLANGEQSRNLKSGDFVTIETLEKIKKGERLLKMDEVIEAQEMTQMSIQTDMFNAILRRLAQQKNWVVFEYDEFLSQVKNQKFNVNNASFKGNMAKNDFFSADGLQPNPLGNAVLANEILKKLNESFGLNLPEINLALVSEKTK